MKVISGFFKFFAVILCIVVVLALPLALLGQSAGSLLFSPAKITELVDENLLNTEVMAGLARVALTEANIESNVQSPYVRLALRGLKEFSHDELVEVIDLIAPPELISTTMQDIVKGYYRWIVGDEVVPRIYINITGWKDTLGKNFPLVAEMVLSKLPSCNSSELMQYSAAEADPEIEIPLCEPPEPQYSNYLNAASEALPSVLLGMEDEIDIIANNELTEAEWLNTKEGILGIRVVAQVAWIGVLVLYVMIIPLGARSFSGVLKWAAWPLLLSGGFLLVIALIFFAPARAAGSVATMANDGVPPVLHMPVRAVVEGIFTYLARPLLWQSIAMIFLGVAGIGGAIFIDSRQNAIHDASTVVQQEIVAPADAETMAMPTEVVEGTNSPPVKDEAKGEDEKDDSQPSGMFG